MDVWIVEAGMSYEGGSIMGVRSTEALAKQLHDKILTESLYDWVYTSEHTVDEGVRGPNEHQEWT